MRKTALALLAATAIRFASNAGAVPASRLSTSLSAVVDVTVGSELVDTLDLAHFENGVLMVPLRSVCEALGAEEVIWDASDNSAVVRASGLEMYIPFGAEYIEANGRYFYSPGGTKVTSGRCVVPAQVLALAFGAALTCDVSSGSAHFSPAGRPIESGSCFYGEEDVYWLSRIIQAEAGAEPFEGKIAVGNVVLNRAADKDFPDTVKEVIFDRRYGVQFTPAYSGSINNSPSSESIIAAKLALEGTVVVEDALYFASLRAAKNCWASRHCQVLAEISGHVFFG